MNYGTLPSRFLNAVDNLPNPRAQMFRRDGRWQPISSQEFLRRVAGLSAAFVELGVKPGDRLGLFSANRPEWHTADFAITGAGGIAVPVYFNESPDRMTYILKHCGAKAVFVAGQPQLQKLHFCSNVTDLGQDFHLDPAVDVALSFLPLAHVYGRTVDYINILQGAALAYVESIDEVAQALLEVRPSVTSAVPRFFEKIYARIMEQGSRNTGVKRMLFDWAMKVARQAVPWRASGSPVSFPVKLQWMLADALVYKKIRLGTGGRLRLVSSGGAPLAKDLADFFWAVGIPIYQGYGLTETSPIVSSNYPVNREGSSGKPIANVQVRIAEDGEILVKGPCVMQGYYKNPEATREVLSEDGWLRTGDIGYLDKDNYLYITDRKKDLLKTAAGKFVAPQPIENSLKTSPYLLNAVVLGDKRKFIVALLVPNPATVAAKAADAGLQFASKEEMVSHPWVHSLIDSEVRRLTANLAQYETIKRFALLPDDFTFDNGSLTFTLKLKRRVVEQKYRDVIESLYADVAEPRPLLQD